MQPTQVLVDTDPRMHDRRLSSSDLGVHGQLSWSDVLRHGRPSVTDSSYRQVPTSDRLGNIVQTLAQANLNLYHGTKFVTAIYTAISILVILNLRSNLDGTVTLSISASALSTHASNPTMAHLIEYHQTAT